jgi:proline dehydrogenase
VAIVDRAIARFLPAVPKPVVRRISERYIAGEELDDALRVVLRLNAEGKMATIDVLGEEIGNQDEARSIAAAYRDAFGAIERGGLDSNVSVKPTALGLELGYELFRENLLEVVEDAARRGNFVRIDMEDASTTDDTLRLYRELRESGHDNVGIVLQARLKRTLEDVAALADLRPSVRLCKGIYLEPAEIAFRDFEAIRGNFVQVLDALWDAGCYVGVATHDEWLVEQAKRGVAERGLGRDDYELQMLLGVRPGLADALVREGHRLRIYTPFGRYWYAYSLRRLQENPKIAGYIAADTFNRLIPGRNGGV